MSPDHVEPTIGDWTVAVWLLAEAREERDYHKTRFESAWDDMSLIVNAHFIRVVPEAVAAEREACAQIAEDLGPTRIIEHEDGHNEIVMSVVHIADAIRRRGEES